MSRRQISVGSVFKYFGPSILVLVGILSLAVRLPATDFFPVGLYCVDSAVPYTFDVTQEFPIIAAAGFNLIQAYQFEGDITTIAEARNYLNVADRFTLKVLMGIPRGCVLNRNLPCIRETVSALKDHPALFGWELFDEPDTPLEAPAVSAETLILAYNTIKQVDPIHPVTIGSFLQIDESYSYMNSFDLFMSAYLLFPTEPLTTPIVPYTEAAFRVLNPRGKSVLTHALVYNIARDSLIWPPNWPESLGHYPTRDEIRFLSYYAILRGSKGVFFNCYRFDYAPERPGGDDVSAMNNPSQWAIISNVSSELNSMIPVFLAPTQDPQTAGISIPGGTPVEAMIKLYQGRTYLLTVNPSTTPIQLSIGLAVARFPNPTITLLPERQRITFQSRAFTAQWSSYGVRVYEIIPGTP